ncbi:hypothetical protein SAMN02910317_00964 [Ruminococcaceae bacterium FB2012]|nr:hypothetical protein SAMN02910317_00964 [Ruminococcaceae bacterium FB2012]
MSEEIKTTAEETAEETSETKKKKSFLSENAVEVLVAVFLGITAILTAWASWISSLHGGNQATNYTKSNNLAAEGNSMYNEGLQNYLSDIMVWNTYSEYVFDLEIANSKGSTAEAELIETKIANYIDQNGTDVLKDAMKAMENDDNIDSPFDIPNMTDKYYEEAEEKLAESQELLKEGQKDNSNGDSYNLVSVIYSLVLFMLGIVGVFKRLPNRAAVLGIAVVGLIATTVYMITIPMPTGFSFANYF